MSIGFWIKDECVLSQDGAKTHPREGEFVRLDLHGHVGYYRVGRLMWSYRQIPVAIPNNPPMEDNRLEVHLVELTYP